MSKVLKGVGDVLGIVATVAAFIPGLQPIAAIAGAASAVAKVGSAIIAKRPVNERDGSQLQFKIDPSGPIPYVMGRTAVGGTVVYRDTYGKDNHYQSIVVVLGGGGPYEAIEAFTADRTVVPFSGQSATGYYATWMWQDQQLGATPESDALRGPVGLSGPFGAVPAQPNWGSASKLSGYCAVDWTVLFDTKARRYQNGLPSPGWIVKGAKVYDPRRDSTYPGGSGSCRWAPPSNASAHAAARATWVYSETPALHGLMWRLGIWQRNESSSTAKYQKMGGIGAPIDLIDLPAIVEAANVQEANGWKIGGEVDFGQDKWEVLKLIEQTGGCEPIANGALMSTMVKTPRVSLRTITPADLADGPVTVPGVRPRSARFNGFRAQFRSEAHGWEIVPIDIVQVPDYVTEDGRARTDSGTFSLVTDPDHCAELAAYEVFDSREIDGITLTLKPFATAYRIGHCLTLNLPELGLESRDVIVRARRVDPATGSVQMTFRTETSAKHAAALGRTGVTPPTPTLTSDPDSVIAPATDSWVLTAVTPDATKVTAPALAITGLVDNSRAEAILFEYREVGTTDWTSAGTEPPDQTVKIITGVIPSRSYEAAVRYIARGITSDRLVIGPVTAADQVKATNGLNNATVFAFRRAASTPAGPSATTTYTFATGALTGLNNGWSTSVPAANGNPLYVIAATASATTATDTIAAAEWSGAVIQAQDGGAGSPGTNGLNNAPVFLFKRATSTPAVPSATLTYTFATSILSGTLSGWTQSVPAGTDPVYVTTAAALSSGTTDTITSSEWAAPNVLAQNGADGAPGASGLNNATLFAFKRAAALPAGPSATTTYTFATAALTGLNNGWSTTVPAADGNPLYVIAATASATGATDTIAAAEWSGAVIQAQDGGAGSPGTNGLNNAPVFLFKRATSTPAVPAATLTYTFATSVLSGTLSGWTQTVPAGTDPIYVTTATALSAGATDTIASTEWAAPNVLAQNGTNGINPIVGYLTNESHTVAAAADGTGYSLADAGGTFKVFVGTVDVTASASFAGAGSSYMIAPINATTGVYSTSDLYADDGWADLAATYGGVTIVKRFTLTKSRAGQDGSPAKLLTVASDRQLISYDGTGALSPSSQTTTFTATRQNSTATVTWSMTTSDGTALTASSYLSATTGLSVTMTAAAFNSARGTAQGVIVTATMTDGTTLSDRITVLAARAGADGTNGTSGLNNATVFAYKRAASTPAGPSATTTYTFSTAALTGLNNGWSTTVPAADGNPLYVIAATASAATATDTIAAAEWSGAVIQAQDGAAGAAGLNSASVFLYNRGTSTPAVPSATLTYTFATAVLSGTLSGWTQTVPAGTDPIYVTTATALGTGATDTIASAEWAAPNVLARNGDNGAPGADKYVWIAYADSSDGSVNFTTGAPGGRSWIGIATNQTTATESTSPGAYSWSQYAGPPNFGLIATNGVVVSGSKVIKPTADSAWNGQVYSSESYFGGAFVSFRVEVASGVYYMIGLNSDPTTDANYTSIDYAVYVANGDIAIVNNGSFVYGGITSVAAGDVLSAHYDGATVRYAKNGVQFYSQTASAGLRLWLDSAFFSSGHLATIQSWAAAGARGNDGSPGAPGAGGETPVRATLTTAGNDAIPSSGTTTTTIASTSMTVPAGGNFKISAGITNITAGSNDSAFILTISIAGSVLASAACFIFAAGTEDLSELAALSAQLFSNPTSGTQTVTLTRQRTNAAPGGATYKPSVLLERVS